MAQVITYRPLTEEAGIDSRSVHVRLLMDGGTGERFSLSTSEFPRQDHSTNALFPFIYLP
jgi:hypothetical protein